MVPKEARQHNISTTKFRDSSEMAAVAARARDLEARMTVPQKGALRLAGTLYRDHAESDGNGRVVVVDSKVIDIASTLIRFANGDSGVPDTRAAAMRLVRQKQNR